MRHRLEGPAGCAAHRAGNVRDPTGGRLLTCGDHMEAIPVLASGDHLEVRGWDRVNRAPSRAGVEKRKQRGRSLVSFESLLSFSWFFVSEGKGE